ncbi:MAG: GTP 3',8-cyclase MoaA [Clostridia bacterium]|nr:GTP 3',8-cyclase MoaA [Clostridia bacterium]
MKDSFGREIDYLRISVTDRCNLRCVYCMPEEGVEPISHADVLSYEETVRLVRIFAELGIKDVRLTGGEPLVRRGIESLVSEIKAMPGIETVSITTNGILLPEKLPALIEGGLDAVNISLDTLDAGKFDRITRRTGLPVVLEAIDLCLDAGLNTKINVVAMKGINDDEFVSLAELAKDRNLAVRFIEYMPIGRNDFEKYVPGQEIRGQLETVFGTMKTDTTLRGHGPAMYLRPEGFAGSIGFISAMTCAFCDKCNRVRLTADGFLKLCLQYDIGTSLRDVIRDGALDNEIKDVIMKAVEKKPKEHTFNDYLDAKNIEEKSMNKIGG